MTSLKETPEKDVVGIVNVARDYFNSKVTLPIEWRKQQLKQLYKMLKENEDTLTNAIQKDVGGSRQRAWVASIAMLYNDISLAVDNLASWMKPEFPSVPLVNKMDNCQIRSDPKGVVLIIGAWNYPLQLTMVPLVGAIAAGCCAIIKPSEISINTANVLADLVPKYLDQKAFQIVNGGIPQTTKLLEQKFDHILYTGNATVARIVATAAAKNLTPVTLELGGKSPTIVDQNVDLTVVARRLAWGAFLNAGQTCIRPDYVLTLKDQVDPLVERLKVSIAEFFGNSDKADSDELGRIVNDRHFSRVSKLLEDSKGKVVLGGEKDASQKYIAPTVVLVEKEDALMKGEIFGPILPIVVVKDIDEAIDFINNGEKPLALYVFTNNSKVYEKVLTETSSGSALINDTLMQATVHELPFGGIGESGQGAYHGKHSFDVFSHKKSVMIKSLGLEFANAIRYPPMDDKKLGWVKTLAVSEPKEKRFWFF